MRVAVFTCCGLGDGLISLILSHNLTLEGHEVVTFHPFMQELQAWFPHLPIEPFPRGALRPFDRWFIFYEKSLRMEKVLSTCLTLYRDKTTVLNPIATPHTDYPYWEEGRFIGSFPFADNLVTFCREVLGIKKASKDNGITVPFGLKHRNYAKRVVLHPMSSRIGKNWPRHKFLRLSRHLRNKGFEPVFMVSSAENIEWGEAPIFPNLDSMARFIFESSYMIGNDSGIGHLSSCLGIPTVSICKNRRSADFWRPAFGSPNEVCFPKRWLPNIKKLRWRDRYWHWAIPVRHVIRAFDQLRCKCEGDFLLVGNKLNRSELKA